jgi:hypothetical protein
VRNGLIAGDTLFVRWDSSGWSIAKYSKWLDEQQEPEVWKLIKASLDAYANKVNQRGDSAFDPIFPVMVSLGNYFLDRHRTGGGS